MLVSLHYRYLVIYILITLFAAQAPHFGPTFPHGGYLAVDAAVGELIDLYHVQFYNRKPELRTALLFSLNFRFPVFQRDRQSTLTARVS
jgi:hypothetical protein